MHVAIENNEKLSICKECGGRCCKSMGCEVSTEDFIAKYGEITKDSVTKALKDGEWAIDWWEGDIRMDKPKLCKDLPELDISCYVEQSYYMRVRHVGESAVCGSWGGTCVMWDRKNGCKYDWEHRPTGGKDMPVGVSQVCGKFYDPTMKHESKYDKAIGAVDWLPYFDILDEVIYTREFL